MFKTRKLIALAALLLAFLVLAPQQARATDISVTAANVAGATGFQYYDGTAGATITAGQVCYVDSGSLVQLAKNDTAVHAAARGIAANGASNGQPIRLITGGALNPGGTVVVGRTYYVSANAGGIAPSADLTTGVYVTILGVGTTTTQITLGIKAYGVTSP